MSDATQRNVAELRETEWLLVTDSTRSLGARQASAVLGRALRCAALLRNLQTNHCALLGGRCSRVAIDASLPWPRPAMRLRLIVRWSGAGRRKDRPTRRKWLRAV